MPINFPGQFYQLPQQSITATNPSVGTNGSAAPSSSTEVGFVDNSNGHLVPFSGTNAASGPNVAVTSSALPAGAATSANQVTQEATLAAIQANQTNGSQETQIVGTVPLPTGAATAANQVTQETTLSAIQANQTNGSQETQIVGSVPLPTGAATAANQATQITEETAIAANTAAIEANQTNGTQVAIANQGAPNATPWNENISQWGGTATTLGQKAMAASVPVVIASDQSAIPVTGTLTSAVPAAFTPSVVALVAVTATPIVALNTLRTSAMIYNTTGAIIYVGNSSVGITDIPVPPMAYFIWDNTAALYGYSVLGGNVNVIDEEI